MKCGLMEAINARVHWDLLVLIANVSLLAFDHGKNTQLRITSYL